MWAGGTIPDLCWPNILLLHLVILSIDALVNNSTIIYKGCRHIKGHILQNKLMQCGTLKTEQVRYLFEYKKVTLHHKKNRGLHNKCQLKRQWIGRERLHAITANYVILGDQITCYTQNFLVYFSVTSITILKRNVYRHWQGNAGRIYL